MEQIALQKDLAIGNGNNVGGNIGRHIPRLCFHNGQGRHAAAAQCIAQVCRALQQARMQIKHIAGIGLTAGAALQQQAEGSVGNGVLGKIVVHDQHILAAAHKIFAHGAACVGGNILQRGRIAGRGIHHNAVVQRIVAAQHFHKLRHAGSLLPNGHINAHHALALLVQNGIQRNGGFAGLAVADDQLTLAAADGKH